VVFLLAADITTVAEQVSLVRSAGKELFVHFDLIQGLGKDAAGLRWLTGVCHPTGIITTRAQLVKDAKALGLATVLRTFLVDSQSATVTVEQVAKVTPDFLEVMPGIAPEGIRAVAGQVSCPVIGGGLIKSVPQVKAALSAGALAISTSREQLWHHSFDE
jgi:glycerol uptake operon antiterminator